MADPERFQGFHGTPFEIDFNPGNLNTQLGWDALFKVLLHNVCFKNPGSATDGASFRRA